jgi:predicted AlkP superfamily pyrophosphatase or phosphodiesterase
MRLSRGFLLLLTCLLPVSGLSSAYNARPKLVVIVVIDQFRGDYLERYRDQFGEGGFRLFLDHGAYFTDCNYNYANTVTGPGHATLLTGAYSSGHGIMANEWWDPQKKKMVTSVEDDTTTLLGVSGNIRGASPHNLLADTLGDELKQATQGKSRVFGVSLKDRAAILPAGFAGNGAYWIDGKSGLWVTSTYYRSELPNWAQEFNNNKRGEKYLNLEWKDEDGKVLRTTKPPEGKPLNYFSLVGGTPYGNDYELDFARELVTYEKLGSGPTTDLLVVSLSPNDVVGHSVGPDTPEMRAMALALDHQLADFFTFLGHQIGLANIWIALSADHGVSTAPSAAIKLHLPAAYLSSDDMQARLNKFVSAKFSPGHNAEYVKSLDHPVVWLNEDAFAAAKVKEEDAEIAMGEALMSLGLRGYYTKSQLARGEAPNTELGAKYLHSYSPHGGWYVLGIPNPFNIEGSSGTSHGSPYSYDTHVPLAFYGIPFEPGTYRTHSEPVDLAATLASLLGINAPTHAVGRVLTEALVTRRSEARERPAQRAYEKVEPAALVAEEGVR